MQLWRARGQPSRGICFDAKLAAGNAATVLPSGRSWRTTLLCHRRRRRFSGIRSFPARFRKPTHNIMRYLDVSEDSLCDGWSPSVFFRQRMRFQRAIMQRSRACRRRFRRTGGELLAEGQPSPQGHNAPCSNFFKFFRPWGVMKYKKAKVP